MVKINDIAKEITKQLETYSRVLNKDVEQITDEITKEAVQELKDKSPKNKGDYARNWTRKKAQGGYVLYNRKYQLTHLLERGHAKVNGGRVPGKAHIRPVEEKTIKKYESRIEKAARG